MADETQPDQTPPDEIAPVETPPAAPADDGGGEGGGGGGGGGVSIPSWLAAALVVILALVIGGTGYAIGRASADDNQFAPISEQVPNGGGRGGGDETRGVPGFPGGPQRPDGQIPGGRIPGGGEIPLPGCLRDGDPRDCFEGGDQGDSRDGDQGDSGGGEDTTTTVPAPPALPGT